MPATAAKSGSLGENIHHFSHIRLRVTGSGVLRMTWYSLDDERSKALPNLTMATTTRIMPTKLSNFVEQRARLEFKTTAIDEYFIITRIVIFTKEYGSEYPM